MAASHAMSDQNPMLADLLHSLTTIDQRLSRIEGALRIVQPPSPLLPNGAVAASSEGDVAIAAAAGATILQPAVGGGPRALYPAVRALEAPPEGFTVSSRARMQDELDAWTVPRGYSMRINGTRTHGARQKIRLVCFRGGRSRPRARSPVTPADIAAAKAAGRRKPTTDRASKKCDCPFKFELVELGPGVDRYAVHYTNRDNMLHNHAPADLTLDPRARKLPSQVTAEVDQWLRDNMPIAKIQEELRRRGYAHVLDFDLRNRKRTLLRKDGLLDGPAAGTGTGNGAGNGTEAGAGTGEPRTTVAGEEAEEEAGGREGDEGALEQSHFELDEDEDDDDADGVEDMEGE